MHLSIKQSLWASTQVFAALALASCGGSSSGPTGGTPTPSTSIPTPSPTPPTPTPSGSFPTVGPSPSSSAYFDIGGYDGWGYNGDPATGQVIAGSPLSGDSPRVAFKYSIGTKTYTLVTINLISQLEEHVLFTANADATDPAYTDDEFLGYSGQTYQSSNSVFRLYRGANPKTNLRYSGYGQLAYNGPTGHLNFGDAWWAYGFGTKASAIPTTGTPSYTGVLHGFAVDTTAGEHYTLEGVSTFSADYPNKTGSGSMIITLVRSDGARITLGKATFSGAVIGSLDGYPYPFSVDLTGPEIPNGVVEGKLFGPAGDEITGTFAARIVIPSAGGDIHAHGGFATVKN